MNRLQQLCMAAVFTIVLATTTFAGEIHTPGIVQPPPPPPSASATIAGEIQTGGKDDADSESQLIEDITLALLRTMLSVS